MLNFDQIPLEMRSYNQWVGWKHENRGDKKLTKVPYSLVDSRFASVNNPGDWASFEIARANAHKFDGIGFVLTLTDPFCFVDFDRTDDAALLQHQIDLHTEFDTYSEVSPGNGLHLICKASVAKGRRQGPIEVYSSARFMTMTGNVYNNKPIAFKQSKIDELWASIGGVSSNLEFDDFHTPSELTDREIYDQASFASNGQKFLDLWNGDIETYHHGDHSRADFALVDILAFYTQDREQIKRMFRMSALGRRQKAQREDYVSTMITRAFDNILPRVDLSELMESVNNFVESNQNVNFQPAYTKHKKLYEPPKLQPENSLDDDIAKERVFTMPPGIVGEIAKFIHDQSWKPVPEIATVGALGLMAGLCGRAYNANGSGLNLYLLMLAKTGRGKESIAKGFDKLQEAIAPIMPTIGDFFGPGDVASGQGLLRYLSDHQTKSFVSVFGEFGAKIKQMANPEAMGPHLMTQKVMLDAYSKSAKGQLIRPTSYSDNEKNTKQIDNPAFSFVAECAPSWFDENVDVGMVSTGLLPRFVIVEYDGIRVKSNKLGPLIQPSQNLIYGICGVATCAMTCFQQNLVVNIPFDKEAERLSDALDELTDLRINSQSDSDSEIVSELWNRVHLNTIRIAALIAIGINPHSPVIDRRSWTWAENFVLYNIKKLEEKFSNGTVAVITGESEFAEIEKIENTIVQYIASDFDKVKAYGIDENLHRCKIVPYAYFQRKIGRVLPFTKSKIGASAAIKRALQNLVDNGDLQEIGKAQAISDLGFHGRCFAIRSDRILKKARQLVTGDE